MYEYKCIKDLYMGDGKKEFTKGYTYSGADEDGLILFINDHGELHILNEAKVKEYFKKIN